MRFLGMAGYYRKFCKNFSSIAEPLTNLLKKSTKFKWNDKCQDAFDRLQAILKSAPVLLAPEKKYPGGTIFPKYLYSLLLEINWSSPSCIEPLLGHPFCQNTDSRRQILDRKNSLLCPDLKLNDPKSCR